MATTLSSPTEPTVGNAIKRARITLGLGEVIVASKPSIVRTVLGSCVAAILHVPRLRISALCHAQMPERHGDGRCRDSCPHPCFLEAPATNDRKYVTCCVRHMLHELRRRRVRNDEIVVTLVGGANVLANIDPRWSVASRNVEVAEAMLAQTGIVIAYADTGGTRGRVIEHVSDLNHTKVRYHGSER